MEHFVRFFLEQLRSEYIYICMHVQAHIHTQHTHIENVARMLSNYSAFHEVGRSVGGLNIAHMRWLNLKKSKEYREKQHPLKIR